MTVNEPNTSTHYSFSITNTTCKVPLTVSAKTHYAYYRSLSLLSNEFFIYHNTKRCSPNRRASIRPWMLDKQGLREKVVSMSYEHVTSAPLCLKQGQHMAETLNYLFFLFLYKLLTFDQFSSLTHWCHVTAQPVVMVHIGRQVQGGYHTHT